MFGFTMNSVKYFWFHFNQLWILKYRNGFSLLHMLVYAELTLMVNLD